MSGSDRSSRAWLLEELESDDQPELTKVENGKRDAGDSVPLLDSQADPKSAPIPAPTSAPMPPPTSAPMPVPLPAPCQPAISPDAQADPASPAVIGPASNGSALNSPVSSSPASNGPVIHSAASNSLAYNGPAPAPAFQRISSAAMSLVVRVGLEGQQCWSQTVCASASMTVGAVRGQCAAYLGLLQLSLLQWPGCLSSRSDHGSLWQQQRSPVGLRCEPSGPSRTARSHDGPKGNAVEAVFFRFEQAGSALQRWAGLLSLCFEDLLFLHAGHMINALATVGDLGISSGDVVNVVTKSMHQQGQDGGTAAATSSSLGTPQSQVSTPLFSTHGKID